MRPFLLLLTTLLLSLASVAEEKHPNVLFFLVDDLAKSHPEEAKALLDKLHAWQQDLGAKMPTER